MISNYKNYFGFTCEPFSQNISLENLYKRPGLIELEERVLYAVNHGLTTVITGDIGSGKSTALRYIASKLHPSKYKIFSLIATTSGVNELYRQICNELNLNTKTNSQVQLIRDIKNSLKMICNEKKLVIFLVDEAHLIRLEVFAQFHTLLQEDFDSHTLAPTVLCGQNALIDKLKYHSSQPIASRVMGRSHLHILNFKDMEDYINHHVNIAGVKNELFEKDAMIAIHQGSGGLLRKANYLAKGSLISAYLTNSRTVNSEHVKIAESELI